MTRARAFCGFVLGVFGGGALVAPWLWWLGRWARTRWPWAELDWLVDHPFPRYVHRCLLVLALAGLWPLSRAVGCRTWEAVGWGGRPGCWRRMAIGFMAGMFGFSVLLGAEMWMGARVWKEGMDGSLLVAGILRAMLAGVVVAVVEETLFRGVLFEGLRPTVGVSGAVLVSASLFSLAHFFAKPAPPDEVTWTAGFQTLIGMLAGFGDWDRLMPEFLTLFLLGFLFARMRFKEGGVHGAVGWHAALVFWIKMRGLLTGTSPIGLKGGDLLSGEPALLLTGLFVLAYSSHARRRK